MGFTEEPGRWTQKALKLIGAGVLVVVLAVAGIRTFVLTFSTRLHQSPQDVPSVALGAPSPKWAAAVDQARPSVRDGLVTQNLPGLSVAVGVGGDIVWAEGFGWADMEKRVPVAPGMRFRSGGKMRRANVHRDWTKGCRMSVGGPCRVTVTDCGVRLL